jgi:opacity protein-like surface antigen
MVRGSLVRATAVVGIAMLVVVPSARGQAPRPGAEQEQPLGETQAPLPTTLPSYPLELLGLLAPPSGSFVLIPSINVLEEYNDNLFLVQTGKTSDFKTELGPALALFVNRPRYRIIAGYSFTSELHSSDSSLDRWIGRQNFLLGGNFSATPDLLLRISDSFSYDNTSGTGGSQPFTVGRQTSWDNNFAAGALWQITRRTSLDVAPNYEARRFIGSGIGVNSDTYDLPITLSYALTSRFSGTIGYEFTYLNIEGDTNSTTHTPRLGFRYSFTPSLYVYLDGGPAITEIGGETTISPSITAGATQFLRFGYINAEYLQRVAVGGGFGGTTDTQTARLTFAITRLVRDFVFFVTPSYNTAKSVSNQQTNQVDVTAYEVGLGATYRLSRYVTIFGGYNFLRQRTGAGATTQLDADQNRVTLGLQFGYPLSLN